MEARDWRSHDIDGVMFGSLMVVLLGNRVLRRPCWRVHRCGTSRLVWVTVHVVLVTEKRHAAARQGCTWCLIYYQQQRTACHSGTPQLIALSFGTVLPPEDSKDSKSSAGAAAAARLEAETVALYVCGAARVRHGCVMPARCSGSTSYDHGGTLVRWLAVRTGELRLLPLPCIFFWGMVHTRCGRWYQMLKRES